MVSGEARLMVILLNPALGRLSFFIAILKKCFSFCCGPGSIYFLIPDEKSLKLYLYAQEISHFVRNDALMRLNNYSNFSSRPRPRSSFTNTLNDSGIPGFGTL